MSEAAYNKGFPVSWEQMHRDARASAWRLLEHGPYKGIIAFTRGVLVPAAIIARELDIRLIDTVCIRSYSDKTRGDLEWLKGVEGDGTDMLIIDDLVDTGKTAKAVREKLPHAHFATVYAKPLGREIVDSFVTEVSQDTWIYFPWDMELSVNAPISERAPGKQV